MAHLRFGASPDPDDVFMVWAVENGLVDTRGHDVELVHEEIAVLNRWSTEQRLELTGLSAGWWPRVADRYTLLRSGGSAGEGYGPVVVASPDAEDATGGTIAVPGTNTTAYMVARHGLGAFDAVELPFDEVLPAVLAGKVDAGLLIHEQQIAYAESGLDVVFDCYRHFHEHTGLDVLPLGVVAVSNALPASVQRDAAAIFRRSIEVAMANRDEALAAAASNADGVDVAQTDRYLDMYVNDRTLDWGDAGRAALEALYGMGRDAGVLDSVPDVTFLEEGDG